MIRAHSQSLTLDVPRVQISYSAEPERFNSINMSSFQPVAAYCAIKEPIQ